MTYNRVTVVPALIARQASQDGHAYSEDSPPGSFDDGHLWAVGDPDPVSFCCSGFEYWSWLGLGVDVGNGTAVEQHDLAVGGRVALANLAIGDSIYFLGAGPPPIGHVGTVVTFNHLTGTGTFRSALGKAFGVCVVPFDIRDVVGASRPANALPNPPAPPPVPPRIKDVDVFITANPNGAGDFLCCWSTRRAVGIPDGPDEIQVETTGVVRHNINSATFAYFSKELWPAPSGA